MKRCMYCGNENDDSSQNCSKCGNPLLELPPQQAMNAEDVPEEDLLPDEESEPDTQDIKISEEGMEEPDFMNQGMPLEQPSPSGYGEQGYPWQPEVQQQYGGQAYGYQHQAQQYGQPAAAQGGYEYGRVQMTGGSQQLMLKARKMVKSPLFFLVLLLQTVMTVSSIINVVGGNVIHTLNALQAAAQSAFGSSMAIRFLNGIIDMAEGLSSSLIMAVGAVIGLPSVIVCLGLWLAFLLTRRNNDPVATTGYTMIRVMVLLKFIVLCLLLTGGLIISVAFVVAAGASSSTVSIIVGIILLVVMILISVFTVLFYVQFLHGLKVIKINVKTGTDIGRIPLFVPVMAILLCIVTILGMLPMSPDDYLGLVSQGASAAWLLFGGLWLLVYRAKVRR